MVSAQLSSTFYANHALKPFPPLNLLKTLQYQGCDASVLLDKTATKPGEKNVGPNPSLRGYEVIDTIKSQLENLSPGVVFCADILAVAARDSAVALSAPNWYWTVDLGRRDSATASSAIVTGNFPLPTLNLIGLISAFSKKGFTAKEMMALSVCPSTGGDNNLAPLDVTTPTTFDNAYYTNLINKKGLLHSDQQLFSGGATDSIVTTYSNNVGNLITDFANAVVKMGRLSPLTGTSGQIRKNCRKAN
nr:cationic peroxidase 1 [Quercus suber]